DDELQRQALRAWQRRKLKGRDAGAGDAVPLLLQLLLQLPRALGPFVPRLEQHAAEALIGRRHAGDLEHLIVFRGLMICVSTTPWSSWGASSDFDVMNR